jgi:hypothetical protein
MPAGGIRTHNFSRRVAEDQRLRPRGHRDRHLRMCRTYQTELLLHPMNADRAVATGTWVVAVIVHGKLANQGIYWWKDHRKKCCAPALRSRTLTIHNTHWSKLHLPLASQFQEYKLKSSMRLYCITFMPNIVRRESNFLLKISSPHFDIFTQIGGIN